MVMTGLRDQMLKPPSMLNSFKSVTKQMATEDKRKRAFAAFRVSVLLLRDLCTEYDHESSFRLLVG